MKDYFDAKKAAVVSQVAGETEDSERLREKLIESSLCANCKNLGDCIYPLKATGPILECEMHECGPTVSPKLFVVKTKQRCLEESPGLSEHGALGLCVNCANLPHCKLPKHPGGVWHCEEYE